MRSVFWTLNEVSFHPEIEPSSSAFVREIDGRVDRQTAFVCIRLFNVLRELRRADAAHSDDQQCHCQDQGTVSLVLHTIAHSLPRR